MADFLDDFEWHRDSLGYRLVTEPIPWKALPLGLLGRVEYDFNSVSKPTLVVRRNGGELIPYRPLKEFDKLYGVFAGIRNSDGVLDFIEKFGPLTSHGKLANVGEMVSHVLEQARMFNDWLKRKKSQQLAAWISAGVKQINPGLTVSLVVDPPGVVRVRLVPRDLLEGLWLQLALKLRGTETIRACEHCGNWFEAGVGTGRRADAKFCSDEHRIEFNSRKRSTPLAIRRRP